MYESIAKAVSIFRLSPHLGDKEIFDKLVSNDVERKTAARIVEFVPMAYIRILLEKLGIQSPDSFERRLPDGRMEKRQLSSEPVWNAAMDFAKDEASQGISGKDVILVAGRSAEFQVANRMLNDGSTPDDIAFTPTLLLWPEDGPEDQFGPVKG